MLIILISFIIIILLVISIWLILFFLFNNLSYPDLNLDKFSKLLVLFPHPDDEALTCSGLIQHFSKSDKKVALYLFTMGERGQEGAKLDLNLKKIREKESKKVAQILRISKRTMFDMGDGELPKKKEELTALVKKIIADEKPDLIVTYDLSGIYGHPDHIVLTEIVKSLVTEQPSVTTLFVSYPPNFYRFVRLPTHMANDKTVLQNRSIPTHKLFLGLKNINRIRALYAYKSQLFGFKKSSPVFPLWFTLSARLFEYYYLQQQAVFGSEQEVLPSDL